jgi:hypothetical protein
MTKRVILYLGDAPSLLTAAILDRANKSVAQDPNAPETALLWKVGRAGVVTVEPRPDGSQVATPVGVGEVAVACLERTKSVDGLVNTTGHDELILEVRPASGNHVIIEIGQPDPTLIVPLPVAPAGLTPEQTKARNHYLSQLDARVKAGNITLSAANKLIAESDAQFLASQSKPGTDQGAQPPARAATQPDGRAQVESDARRAVREDAAARLGLPKTATWADIAAAQAKA